VKAMVVNLEEVVGRTFSALEWRRMEVAEVYMSSARMPVEEAVRCYWKGSFVYFDWIDLPCYTGLWVILPGAINRLETVILLFTSPSLCTISSKVCQGPSLTYYSPFESVANIPIFAMTTPCTCNSDQFPVRGLTIGTKGFQPG